MNSVDSNGVGRVAIVIRTQVRGDVDAFRDWQKELGAGAAKVPGFLDQAVLPPQPPEQTHWVTIQWFSRSEDAFSWLNSLERRTLIEAAPPSVLGPDDVHVVWEGADRAGLERWFRMPASEVVREAWKMSMLVLLVLYPTVLFFNLLISAPLLLRIGVPSWLALFVSNVFCVCVLGIVVPWTGQRFRWWIEPTGGRNPKVDRQGIAVLIGLYVATLVIGALATHWLSPLAE